MADIADIAAESMEVTDAVIRASLKQVARRPGFCDCESWACGQQFCGDRACRDSYEAEDRRLARTGGGSIPIRQVLT